MTHRPALPLAHAIDRPAGEPWGGMLILHGAGSRKENHADMARAAAEAGLVALRVDLRGHGATGGTMDGRAIADVAAAAAELPAPRRPPRLEHGRLPGADAPPPGRARPR